LDARKSKEDGTWSQNGMKWVTHEKKICVGRDEELRSHKSVVNLSLIMIPYN